MKFAWFLALRYLKPKRTFISIITVISILGVALGVGVLIVVIAVMSGFERRIKDEWLKVEPPVHLYDDTRSFLGQSEGTDENKEPEWRALLRKVKTVPGVEGASAFINVVSLTQIAPPKQFNDTSVPVDPGNLPPDAPPPPEGGPAPEGNPPPGAPPAPEKTAPPPPPPPGDGVRGDPATAGPAARPAEKVPAPAQPPAAAPPADQKIPAPEDATPDDPTPPADLEPEIEDEGSVTGLDRTRPLAPAVIIGVDTDDPAQMGKLEKRFYELMKRTRTTLEGATYSSARGEFDITGDTVVISSEVYRKLADGATGPIDPGLTHLNIFGPSYINEGINIIEEQRQAKGDQSKLDNIEKKDRDYPLPMDLAVTGVFDDDKQSGGSQGGIGYVSLTTAQSLAGAGKAVDGIYVDISDPYDAPAMADKLMAAGLVPPGWHVETWIQRHRQQFDAVANERSMMYIVLAFIVLVAAFCICNTMITFAVQKRREIGMMRALGAKTSHIVSLFTTKGLIVGVMGTALGYGLGQLVLLYRNNLRDWINNNFGHQIFDAAIYGLNEIPAELRVTDQVVICTGATLICTIAAMIPAFLVGYMEPAKALRNDR